MSITQVLDSLGSWQVQLVEATPADVVDQLGYFGHVAVVDGPVDVAAAGDGILAAARYVGVCRAKPDDASRTLGGSGLLFWLGDEDDKGDGIEDELDCSGMTLDQAVHAILDPAQTGLTVGTVHPKAGTLPAGTKFLFVTPRKALAMVCDAFAVEPRVNHDFTVDVGTPEQLGYRVDEPAATIVRRAAGSDVDLVGLGGDFTVDEAAYDLTTRVVLLGQTIGTGDEPDEVFATGSADALSVDYLNPAGNPVKFTRFISESSQTSGSVEARAQLQLNRFNRLTRSLAVKAEQFETEGDTRVGDWAWVFDPDTGIVDEASEVLFRGEVLHPDRVRITGATWPVVEGMTVAFRTDQGDWLDLTPFVTWETGAAELTVGDLPKSLTRPGDDPVQVRIDAARASGPDGTIPSAPAGLTLSTEAHVSPLGQTVATVTATWNPVTTNEDSSVITDLSHYRVEWRPSFRAPAWNGATAVQGTTVDITGLTPDLDHDVRVAAVDRSGNQSDWSTVATIHTEPDDEPPPAPADPLVTSYLGQLRIEYVGTDSLGDPMPADTNRVDVHVSSVAGFTPSSATRVSSLTPQARGVAYATAPYGSTRYVRLVAVDHSGNASSASAEVSGSTVQVADGDIAALSVGKLTAGTIAVDVVVSGRLTTALTGARSEMNAVGFQAWDASEDLTIDLNGVDNLLTGYIRTGLSGRRQEMGAAGMVGELRFYAPDNTYGFVRSFTAGNGIEVISLGTPRSGQSNLWNAWSAQQNELLTAASTQVQAIIGGNSTPGGGPDKAFMVRWAQSSSATDVDGTFPRTSTTVNRFQINSVEGSFSDSLGRIIAAFRADSGETRFLPAATVHNWTTARIVATRNTVSGTGSAAHSPELGWVTQTAVGGKIRMHETQGLEVVNYSGTAYDDITASAFIIGSDERTKENVRPFDDDPMAMLGSLGIVRFRRKVAPIDPDAPPDVRDRVRASDEVGVLAQQVPDLLRRGTPDNQAVDITSALFVAIAAIKRLGARVAALEGPKGIRP